MWAYSRYVRDCYVDSGVDPDRVAIVPAGIDPERFRPGLQGLETLPEGRGFRFLFVGGTLYRKGIDVLLRAYHEAFDAGDDVSLIIKDMGVDTFYRKQTAGDRIRQLQADPSCADIIYLTQDMPGRDMPRLYASADALVHPYRGEGFGLPVAEAMACGLPVIVTRGGACDDFCPEPLVYGVQSHRQAVQLAGQETVGQAWQLEPDVESLKAQMRAVFERREAAAERALAASDHVRTRVTWQVAASAALEAIDKLRTLDMPTVAVGPAASVAAPAAPAAPTAAVVLLGQATADTGSEDPVAAALGPHHRFHVDTAAGHRLGEQLDAILANVVEAGAERLFVLATDIEATADDLRHLAAHLDAVDEIAMVGPASRSRPAGEGLVECAYPDASCLVIRLQALADAGGFDATFGSTAVFANAARSLRRKGWRVVTAMDVDIEEGDDTTTGRLLPFGNGVGLNEAGAVESMERGDALRDAGEVHGAIECYRRALEHKPDFVETILVLADSLLEAGDGEGAIAAVGRLVEIDASSSFAHNYAGLIAARAGDRDAARRAFTRAIELEPGQVETRVNLGVIEWEARDLDAALKQFREASRLDPHNRDLVCNLGLVYGQIEDDEAAENLYRGYLEQYPEDVEILGRLADVLLGRQNLEGARELARQILRHEPDHARARAILEEQARENRGEDETAQG